MKINKLLSVGLSLFVLASCGSNNGAANKDGIVNNAYYYFDTLVTESDPTPNYYRVKFDTKNTLYYSDFSSTKDFSNIKDSSCNKYKVVGEVHQYLQVRLYYGEELTEENSTSIYIKDDFSFVLKYMFSLPKDNFTYEYTDANDYKYVINFNTSNKEFNMDITSYETRAYSGTYTIVRDFNEEIELNLNTGDSNYHVSLLEDTVTLVFLR